MFGRREFAVAGLSALGIAALQVQAQEKRAASGGGHAEHDEMLRACAKACSDCQRECDSCATHCAHQLADGKKDHYTTLMTCRDCATLCSAAAEVVSRGGPFAGLICDSCAKACAECAKACEKFPDDQHMKACAAECRKCQKACENMPKHAHH